MEKIKIKKGDLTNDLIGKVLIKKSGFNYVTFIKVESVNAYSGFFGGKMLIKEKNNYDIKYDFFHLDTNYTTEFYISDIETFNKMEELFRKLISSQIEKQKEINHTILNLF